MDPTPEQLARLAYDMERSRSHQSTEAFAAALEVEDLRFVELIRLRRSLRSAPWWQYKRRRWIKNQIISILDAQKATAHVR